MYNSSHRLGTATHLILRWSRESRDIKLPTLGRGEFLISHCKQRSRQLTWFTLEC